MSEKLDGVRAFWDGKELISRTGDVFHAPAWFKARRKALSAPNSYTHVLVQTSRLI